MLEANQIASPQSAIKVPPVRELDWIWTQLAPRLMWAAAERRSNRRWRCQQGSPQEQDEDQKQKPRPDVRLLTLLPPSLFLLTLSTQTSPFCLCGSSSRERKKKSFFMCANRRSVNFWFPDMWRFWTARSFFCVSLLGNCRELCGFILLLFSSCLLASYLGASRFAHGREESLGFSNDAAEIEGL